MRGEGTSVNLTEPQSSLRPSPCGLPEFGDILLHVSFMHANPLPHFLKSPPQCALVAYEAMTDPSWLDPALGGPYRWVEYAMTATFVAASFVMALNSTSSAERIRQHDAQVGVD